jgi:hypothetical protein
MQNKGFPQSGVVRYHQKPSTHKVSKRHAHVQDKSPERASEGITPRF